MLNEKIACPKCFRPGQTEKGELFEMTVVELPTPNPLKPPPGYRFPSLEHVTVIPNWAPQSRFYNKRKMNCSNCGFSTIELGDLEEGAAIVEKPK